MTKFTDHEMTHRGVGRVGEPAGETEGVGTPRYRYDGGRRAFGVESRGGSRGKFVKRSKNRGRIISVIKEGIGGRLIQVIDQ